MRLGADFFGRCAISLAPELLGKLICVNRGDVVQRCRITETECYFGQQDTACHASRGRTARNAPMYSNGGVLYVYLCYGIHHLLNIVTGPADHPEAVLIRGVVGAPGPGRVTRLLGVDRSHNWLDLGTSTQLWLEDDGLRPQFVATERIGIDYAQPIDRQRLWRFVAQNK